MLLDVARASDIMTSFILVYFLRSSIRDSMYSMRSSFSSLAFCSTFTADSRDAISFWSLRCLFGLHQLLFDFSNVGNVFILLARWHRERLTLQFDVLRSVERVSLFIW